MKNLKSITKSVVPKLSTTLALVLVSGSLYAGGGIWNNNNSKSNKFGGFGNNKNVINKKNSFKNKKRIKPGKKGPHGNKPGRKKPKSVPIDGGLGILLLGATAFGVKKLRGNS